MPNLPRATGPELIRLLERQGFTEIRRRGSHRTLARGATSVTVPDHGSRPLKIGSLRDIGMTPDGFSRLWRA